MRVTSAESTQRYAGPADAPRQLVAVTYRGCTKPTTITVEGDGIAGSAHIDPGTTDRDGIVEVPVDVDRPVPGENRRARVLGVEFDFTVAEPGWTMYMISHFHYDPVWWNTQAAYTSVWTEDPPGQCRQTHGFDLVRAHLEMARREPEYKFVLAEVDYLKPYWDVHPEDRADLRRFIAEGRVEIMGGTYNEPNTNLTSPETAIRNFVHGMGFQRDILGAAPATAWQLDVFGHDPQFPGMAADAGLTSSSWARGPHHQWGPMQNDGDPERMQFSSEFEWIAPSGRGLLTHYMPAHYSAGWWMDSSATLAEAEDATYTLFTKLKRVALTRNVLLPVGTDYTPPNKWVTEIHRDWNSRYVWPKFVCALPAEFFAAVRAELDERGITPSPQTRDMNPIYTGKDVSYIDTKQANRAAEDAVLDAERFAVFAGLLGGADYPQAALAKAWVQLAYGAHHDAITGSESDQVYLDLLTGWRDAGELGTTARSHALELLSEAVDGSLVVWNALAHNRTDIVTAHLDRPFSGSLVDTDGNEVPVVIQDDGRTVSWLARDVPSLGWRAYRLAEGPGRGWSPMQGDSIANEHYRLRVDATRGGGVTSLVRAGRELIAAGGVGNELAVYDEYSAHPQAGEGPWHLLPRGPVVCSSAAPAEEIRCHRSALGQRVVVRGRIGELLRYTQTITLWNGVDRVDCRTVIDGFAGEDRLLRLRWPCPVPGALPVSEVGDAVIGRGFGLMHPHSSDGSALDSALDSAVDSARHPWTLDNPAYGWFGLSSAVRIRVGASVRAVSVAEVVTADEDPGAARDLMVALVRAGVTATCSSADRPRYGDLSVDSNLPDTRLALGGPDENPFTAAVLADADTAYTHELKRQLDADGTARVWVPAAEPLTEVWVPGADLRAVRALPVLILAGDIDAVIDDLADDLADAEITVEQRVPGEAVRFEDYTVAVLNRGVPGFAIDPDGTLHTSLMRSCTGWPSGTWIDPPRRTAPDGSNFALQHWTHTFDYAVVAGDGDWRDVGAPARAAEFNRPLLAVPTADGRGEHPGGLPPWGSLLEVEPAEAVQLGALKATGNPLASGSVRTAGPADGITARLVEITGAATEVAIRSGLRNAGGAVPLNLLEEPVSKDPSRLHGYEISTLSTRLNLPQLLRGEHRQLAPEAEAAQPVYARYWLHNRGPAPLGGLPAVAHLHPENLAAEPDSQMRLRLTVASDCTDAPLHGRVRVILPPGWATPTTALPFVLPPGEFLETEVAASVPAGVEPGLYPVRAQLAVIGGDAAGVPPSWRQCVEDVCMVTVGAPDAHVLRLLTEPQAVDVAAGESARLRMTVGTDARADLTAEAHLISPWGTWEWMGPAAVGTDLRAGGSAEIAFDVAPPPWVAPGRWWALIRVGCAGRLLYSPAVEVVVR